MRRRTPSGYFFGDKNILRTFAPRSHTKARQRRLHLRATSATGLKDPQPESESNAATEWTFLSSKFNDFGLL
jgi:hypothetical protein